MVKKDNDYKSIEQRKTWKNSKFFLTYIHKNVKIENAIVNCVYYAVP